MFYGNFNIFSQNISDLTKESKLQNDTQLHEFFQRQTNKFRQNEIFKKKTT